MIADNVGVEYSLTPPNPYYERYKDEMNEHTRRYWRNLQDNKIALEYLKETRGILNENIDLFRLGYVPLDEYTRRDTPYISGRISFPILEVKHDLKLCKCLAMGYRTLKDEKPKYVNDKNQTGDPGGDGRKPQDPNIAGVFVKNQCLYGLSHSINYIKKANSVIVVEGYFDVISLYQSQIKNIVGLMSTSLSEYNINVLKNLTSNLILFLDNDSAGFKSTIKQLPTLFEKGFNVKLVITKENNKMDPADMCLGYNFDRDCAVKYINDNCVLAAHYQLNELFYEYEKKSLNLKRNCLAQVSNILKNITNPTDLILYEDYVKKRLN